VRLAGALVTAAFYLRARDLKSAGNATGGSWRTSPDPEEPRGFYSTSFQRQAEPEQGSVEALMEFIMAIDVAARVLIELALMEATDKAATDKTRAMLRDAIVAGRDIEAIQKLIELHDRFNAADENAVQKLVKRAARPSRNAQPICKGVPRSARNIQKRIAGT
jgi:hypothetical protein